MRAAGDPYALVPAVTRVIREISADQPVERAATLEDVRAEVLSPERVNAFVFSGFAGIALLIAVVGVAGVLAFSVSARTREFGVRLAVGSAPRQLLARVLSEGVVIAAIGIAAGAAGGYVLARVAARFFSTVQMPGALPVLGAAAVLIAAAVARVADARRARVARGRAAGAPIGIGGRMTLIRLHVTGGAIGIVSGLVALYALKGAAAAPEERNDLRLRDAAHVAQRRRDGGGACGGGDEHPCGAGDGLSRHHRRCSRCALRPADRAAVGARRDAGGVRARPWRASCRRRRVPARGTPAFVFSALDVRCSSHCSAGVGDRRMIRAGGLRVRRDSGGTCGACASRCLIAAASFFLGPVTTIPEPLRIPALRLIPLVVLVTMVYWLWRYRRKRTRETSSASAHKRQSYMNTNGPTVANRSGCGPASPPRCSSCMVGYVIPIVVPPIRRSRDDRGRPRRADCHPVVAVVQPRALVRTPRRDRPDDRRGIAERPFVHASIAGGAMGNLSYILAIPTLSVALVAWAAVEPSSRARRSRRRGGRRRRARMSAVDAAYGPVASTPTGDRTSTCAGRRLPRSSCSLRPPRSRSTLLGAGCKSAPAVASQPGAS